MKKIKPKNSKFLKEFYFNPTATIVFFILFTLNSLNVIELVDNKNIQVIFSIVFFILMMVFLFKTIINLFYKIEITDEIITFNTPFNLYKKRIAFSTINDFRFKSEKVKDDSLVFFLNTGEVVSVGITRYSKDQKEYLNKTIKNKTN